MLLDLTKLSWNPMSYLKKHSSRKAAAAHFLYLKDKCNNIAHKLIVMCLLINSVDKVVRLIFGPK